MTVRNRSITATALVAVTVTTSAITVWGQLPIPVQGQPGGQGRQGQPGQVPVHGDKLAQGGVLPVQVPGRGLGVGSGS